MMYTKLKLVPCKWEKGRHNVKELVGSFHKDFGSRTHE